MTGGALRVAAYRLRRTLRSRVGGYLTIALLLGLVGGLALGAVAGARRTQSAFPRYLQRADASDLQFQGLTSGGFSVDADVYSPAFTRRLATLPDVRAVAGQVQLFAVPLAADGRPNLPAAMQDNVVDTIGGVGGRFFTQDRVVADQGRVPDPARADEFAVTADAARLLHWHVGQTISFAGYSFAQVISAQSSLPPTSQYRFRATLVGIVALTNTAVRDAVDRYPAHVLFTPAVTAKALAIGGAGFTTYSLQLSGGSGDVAAVEREIIGILPPGMTYSFRVTSISEDQVERAVKPLSIALGAFGLIALIAAMILAGQAVSRAIRSRADEGEVLRALGGSSAAVLLDGLLGVLLAVVAGAVVAAVVCVALSPVAPIGSVRQIDPSPGFVADWTVLGAGVGALLVVVSGAAITAALASRRRAWATDAGWRQPSKIVGSGVRLGLPAPSIVGLRFALERGRGRDAVPAGSVLLGAVLAVTVVVTTLTFGSSLRTLVARPALYGWNWDYAVVSTSQSNVPPVAARVLDHSREVAAWTGFDFGNASIDGMIVPIMLTRSHAPISPPVLTGHALDGDRQIVLGASTLAALHKKVGDTVVATYGSPADAPVYVPPTRVRIVGTATLPAIGATGTEHPSMATGAIVSRGIEPPAMVAALTNPDPVQQGPAIMVVRLRQGVSRAAGLAAVQRAVQAADEAFADDPASGGGLFAVDPVQQPAEIVNYRTMGSTPAVLAGALALGAVVALGLTMLASVRRRRRELALLRTMGFVRHQLLAVVTWQASVAAVVGVVVGVPAGIAVGRSLWNVFAREIGAVALPTVPALEVVLAVLGALVMANVVAFGPGRLAARTSTAALLRAE